MTMLPLPHPSPPLPPLGVAPRAKMNQQRSRRFKAAKEAQERQAAAPPAADDARPVFDSNCITPGTPFMMRLGEHLRFFIRRRMEEDPVWAALTVIFSGHEVPGEGEHKIMEHLRWARLAKAYPPNTRHCMYGLDADLVMLSLVTHEPHFCLMREIVTYGGARPGQPAREVLENPCREHFVFLNIGYVVLYWFFSLEEGGGRNWGACAWTGRVFGRIKYRGLEVSSIVCSANQAAAPPIHKKDSHFFLSFHPPPQRAARVPGARLPARGGAALPLRPGARD